MSEFYNDYKEWLSTFKVIRETEDSEEVEYDAFGNPKKKTMKKTTTRMKSQYMEFLKNVEPHL